MEEFPFTEDEWNLVGDASTAIVNASLAEDVILGASLQAEMYGILDDLQLKYGEHPVLIETRADFTSDRGERVALYQAAKRISQAHGLPTYTIIISLADVLIDELGELAAARDDLLSCRAEIEGCGDDYYTERWQALLAKCTDTE
jgi:hypothetical protein